MLIQVSFAVVPTNTNTGIVGTHFWFGWQSVKKLRGKEHTETRKILEIKITPTFLSCRNIFINCMIHLNVKCEFVMNGYYNQYVDYY